ncbi:hypothetical protein WR25_19862 [Diploscapter pachys]|uniref:Uncharacterized protein n=1 Tax=Diploscapter pachys TaxID=2018661 RepID=A0A2A2JWA3_9BILA|nr:hypothetical protein WR25_19862 [Diploscapter pachys]
MAPDGLQRALNARKLADCVDLGLAAGAVAHEAFEVPALGTAIAAQGRYAMPQNVAAPFAPHRQFQLSQHGVPRPVNVLNRPAVVVDQPAASDSSFWLQCEIVVELGLQPCGEQG